MLLDDHLITRLSTRFTRSAGALGGHSSGFGGLGGFGLLLGGRDVLRGHDGLGGLRLVSVQHDRLVGVAGVAGIAGVAVGGFHRRLVLCGLLNRLRNRILHRLRDRLLNRLRNGSRCSLRLFLGYWSRGLVAKHWLLDRFLRGRVGGGGGREIETTLGLVIAGFLLLGELLRLLRLFKGDGLFFFSAAPDHDDAHDDEDNDDERDDDPQQWRVHCKFHIHGTHSARRGGASQPQAAFAATGRASRRRRAWSRRRARSPHPWSASGA